MHTSDPGLQLAALAEPYRIKSVEAISLPSRSRREEILRNAHHSIMHIDSADVYIDLLTDSGTGAMSDRQWSAMMQGDEAYVRSRSFFELERAVRQTFGYEHVIPTHQGRAAENIVMEVLLKDGDVVLSNTHFDTTRAHVMNRNAVPVDLMGDHLWDFDAVVPFKGNFDLARLEVALETYHQRVPFILITVLNNFACSSPVSMENIRETRRLADRWKIPVLFDACRFAENAWFIKTREPGYQDKSVAEIAREMFSYGDGCWMSAKKDAIVNIGGFIAVRDEMLARRCQERLVLYEGFPTYGGLAGRDMEAIARGLAEGVDEDYLRHRVGQVAYLADLFEQAGIKTSQPAGGSGVFIDIASLYGHLPPERYPAVAFCCDLYLEGGVRAGGYPFQVTTVDVHSGELVTKRFEFARFALPRRTYTKSHLDYVGKVMERVRQRASAHRGYNITYAPDVLPHFFSRFEPCA